MYSAYAWVCGCGCVLVQGCMGAVYGYISIWVCGCLGVWVYSAYVCGCVGTWVYGVVLGVKAYGYVGVYGCMHV